jgi:hypothetical protein
VRAGPCIATAAPTRSSDGRRAPRALSVPAGAGLTSRAPVDIGHSDTAPRSECPIFCVLRPRLPTSLSQRFPGIDVGDAATTLRACCSIKDHLQLTNQSHRITLHRYTVHGMRQMRFALLAILSVSVLSIEGASAAGSPGFCGTWLKLCNKTCTTGPGTCGPVCSTRYKGCLSSGCFFFNTPGPRCENNAKDQAATVKSKKAMQQGRPVGCGPNFGGRPCD